MQVLQKHSRNLTLSTQINTSVCLFKYCHQMLFWSLCLHSWKSYSFLATLQTWVYAGYKTFQSKSHNNIKNKHILYTAVTLLGYVQLGNANSTHTYEILNSGLLKTSWRSSELSDAEAAYFYTNAHINTWQCC